MSDIDNNMFSDLEEEPTPGEPRPPQSNRTFLLIAGGIGLIILIFIILLVVYLAIIAPRVTANNINKAAQINAQNTATSLAATQNAQAAILALTPSATLVPTETLAPTPTPVIVFATNTPLPTNTTAPTESTQVTQTTGTPGTALAAAAADTNARTQTVSALLTMAAGGTVGPGTPTVLPTTGFADQVGLPGMLGLSILLVAVIFFVRRMRLSGGQG
jgi:LPXTG-motif cell wall-anchored protein